MSDASKEWAAAEPSLVGEDLNPYLTLAATLAASRLSAGLSDELRALVQQLLGENRADRDNAMEAVEKVPAEDQRSIAQALIREARRRDVVDPAVEALVGIGTASPELADDIAADIRTQLASRMTAGAGAELANADGRFRELARELAGIDSTPDMAREAIKSVLEEG